MTTHTPQPYVLHCLRCRELYDTITRLRAEVAQHKINNARLKTENERLQFVESDLHNIDDVVEIARLSQRLREHEAHLSETVRVPVLEAHEREKAAEQA